MHYRKYIIILLLCVPLKIFAQQATLANTDITGLWKGTLYNDTTKQYYRYEIAISKEKGKLTGYSHTWFILDDKQYYGVKKVKIKEEDGKIIIQDDGLIANNYPVAPAKGVKQLNILELNASDSLMTLTGPFTTNSTKVYRPLTGSIYLQRKNDFWQSALVPHLEELGLAKELSFVKDEKVLSRNNDVYITVAKPNNKMNESATVSTISMEKTEIPLPIITSNNEVVKNDTKINSAANGQQVTITTIENNTKTEKPETKKVNKKEATVIAQTQAEQKNKIEIKNTKSSNIKEGKAVVVNNPQKPVAAKAVATTTNAEQKNTVIKTEEKSLPENKVIVASANTPVTPVMPVSSSITPAQEIKNIAAAKEVDTRKTLLEQTVYFASDSLQLTLYDNGEVDGDTVSVLMNGKIIMPRVGLSTNAVRKTIYINNDEDSVQLVMYAENLGSIPPNTGLLVVRDGKDIYEIRFSGDLQKNAAIVFRRKKNK